jgi:hypothetical protein
MLQDRCVISQVTRFVRLLFCHLITISPVIICFFQTNALQAQERVRTAAGQLKIESFKRPEAFFRVGPFQEELTATAGFDFSDNAGLTNTGKVSRFSFYEALTSDTLWTISHYNHLEFVFGGKLTEDFYGNGRNQVNFGIFPGSTVQLQFAVENFKVQLFDQFSYTQEPSTNPTATNTAYLNNLTNTIGAVVSADWHLAIFSVSTDYTYNNQSGSNVQGQTNPATSGSRNSFRVGPSLAFKWSPTVLYGIESTLTRTSGTVTGGTGGSGNVNSINVGPFIRGKLSRLTDIDLAVGATLVDAKPSIAPNYYFGAVVRHQLNRNWQLILSGSHDLIFTTGSDLTEEYVFRAGTQFNLTRFITASGSSFLSFGNEKTGSNPGNFAQYGIGANLAWKPRKHLSTSLTYDFIRREANSAVNTYVQNLISFQINYAF